jgi:hypothetical protein
MRLKTKSFLLTLELQQESFDVTVRIQKVEKRMKNEAVSSSPSKHDRDKAAFYDMGELVSTPVQCAMADTQRDFANALPFRIGDPWYNDNRASGRYGWRMD